MNKRNLVILIAGVSVLVIGIILLFVFSNREDNKINPSSSVSVDSNQTSSSSSVSESSSSSASVEIGDINSDDTTSSQSTSSAIEKDNTVYIQPKPPTKNIGGNDGFTSIKKYLRDVFNYDEFRYYQTLPKNYSTIAMNSKETMREALMFDKDNNFFANDFQSSVSQTGQYVFQNVGITCKNPMDAFFVKYQGNPVAWGQNVYTPWIVKKGATWYVYYGGWGTVDCNGHDTSYLMTTKDPDLRGPYTYHGVVLKSEGGYVHSQDPSVAIGPNGKWVMAYTNAKLTTQGGVDWIGIATSDDGITWRANGNSQTGISDSADSEIKITNYKRKNSITDGYDLMGRPSIYYNKSKNRWEMYADSINFDGASSHVGFIYLFTSTEEIPMNWKYEARICQGGETALAVINDTYYLAYRNDTWPTRMMVMSSKDGVNFSDSKNILTGERSRDGSIQNITQMAFATENNEIKAVMYGRSIDGWTHRVSLAYPQKKVEVWRGNQFITNEAFATSSTTQVISSSGASAPLTKIRVFDNTGRPASLEAFFKLYSGQSVSLIKNTLIPSKPILLGPLNNEAKVLWGTTFYWVPTYMASKYQLQISTDENFNNIIMNRDNILVEQYTLREPLKLGKKYFYRVIAKNSVGSNVSETRSFTVLAQNELIGEYIQVLPNSTVASDDADAKSNKNYISDGPYYTYWTAVFDESNPPYFLLDYGRQYPISKVYWQPRTDYVGWPSQIKLEYSIDGKTFYQLDEEDCLTTNNFSFYEDNYKPKSIVFKNPINARYIRFTVLQTNYSPLAGIAEFRSLILR